MMTVSLMPRLLAQTQVTSNNSWSYVEITPVDVQAEQTYIVAVYLGGDGGSLKFTGAWGKMMTHT